MDGSPLRFRVTFGNEFVMKGDYHFDDLPQIYVISILAGKTYKNDLDKLLYTMKTTEKNQRIRAVQSA